MMTCDTFHSLQNLSHAVRGCHQTVNGMRAGSESLRVSCHRKPVEK